MSFPLHTPGYAVHGHSVDTGSDRFGPLVDSTAIVDESTTLRDRYQAEGYIFIKGLIDRDAVLAARREILLKYAMIGEIDDRHPLDDAVEGNRAGLATANLRAFTESVRTGAHYEAVIFDHRLLSVVGAILDGPVQPYTFRWPRLVRHGEGCGFHCDGPYMSRGTDRHLSTWIPLGAVPPEQSGLMILEDSHVNPDLHAGYLQKDADRDGLVWLDDDPAAVQDRYGRRWLTASYEPGDVLIFSMNTLHGASDNITDRCRLSTDSRYLVEGEIGDPRWNGDGELAPHGEGRVFYPGLGSWANADFQDEWKYVDENGRLLLGDSGSSS